MKMSVDVDFKSHQFPFVVCFSDRMKLLYKLCPPISRTRLSQLLRDTVTDMASRPDVAKPLKAKAGNERVMRQCDIRADDDGKPGEVAFKTFLMWHFDLECWQMLVELPDEQWVEKDIPTWMNN